MKYARRTGQDVLTGARTPIKDLILPYFAPYRGAGGHCPLTAKLSHELLSSISTFSSTMQKRVELSGHELH